jgi:hypothetical protein
VTQHIPRRALVLLAILTLVWGTNWPLFPLATREVSVWTFRAVSVFVAGASLLIVARLRGQSLVIARRHWRTIVVATFFYLVVWNIASTYSALLIPSGQSAVLGFTMPLWSALIAWAVLGERLTARLLLPEKLTTVVVVSQAWHLPRALWAFERVGLKPLPWPAPRTVPRVHEIGDYLPSLSALHDSFYALHEMIGAVFYRLRY